MNISINLLKFDPKMLDPLYLLKKATIHFSIYLRTLSNLVSKETGVVFFNPYLLLIASLFAEIIFYVLHNAIFGESYISHRAFVFHRFSKCNQLSSFLGSVEFGHFFSPMFGGELTHTFASRKKQKMLKCVVMKQEVSL